jgi:hypothetical protein
MMGRETFLTNQINKTNQIDQMNQINLAVVWLWQSVGR